MKSLEQMGELPEQPNNEEEIVEKKEGESETKITTSEEAAEMTRQRRKEFGIELEEERDLKPGEKELEDSITEKVIQESLDYLNQYDFESYSPEIQDKWYWVEQEALAGKDRKLIEANLERFLVILQKEDEKKKNN